MPDITLDAEVGRPIGTSDTRRLRRDGKLPGVVYGQGVEPLTVAVDAKEFRTALSGEQGVNTLLDLVAGKKHYLVLAREIQRHPVRGTVNHVDFQVVNRSQGIEVEVPLQVIGDAVEVRHHDWEVEQQLFSLHVKAQPDKIPNVVIVDISELKVGGAIRVGDLELPEGVEATQDPQTTIVGTHASRVTAVKAPEAEELDGGPRRRRDLARVPPSQGRRAAPGDARGVGRRRPRQSRRRVPGHPPQRGRRRRRGARAKARCDAARRPAAARDVRRGHDGPDRVRRRGAHDLHERVGCGGRPARAPSAGIEDLTRLLIVHDELDLAPGRLQLKVDGGLAGHNGLRSVSGALGTRRLRPPADRDRQARLQGPRCGLGALAARRLGRARTLEVVRRRRRGRPRAGPRRRHRGRHVEARRRGG